MYRQHTERQRSYSESDSRPRAEETIDYAGGPVHERIRQLRIATLARLLRERGLDLSGQRVLVVGCGLGTDLFFLNQRFQPDYSVFDVSFSYCDVTRRHFPRASAICGDAESMPFDDESFDFVFVADSLHHLARPYLCIYEMLRVARKGVCIIEPHQCLLTRLATKTGLMQEFEEAGNYVFKFAANDFAQIALSLGLEYEAATVFASDLGAGLGNGAHRIITAFLNGIIPGQGNAIVAMLLKPELS